MTKDHRAEMRIGREAAEEEREGEEEEQREEDEEVEKEEEDEEEKEEMRWQRRKMRRRMGGRRPGEMQRRQFYGKFDGISRFRVRLGPNRDTLGRQETHFPSPTQWPLTPL